MAALKTGLMKKEWWGLRVLLYATRKEDESSSSGLQLLCRSAWAVKSRPLREGFSL